MFKRSLIIAITVCLFTGAVVLGVHVMHKDALAITHTYELFVETSPGNPVEDLMVISVTVRHHDGAWNYVTTGPAPESTQPGHYFFSTTEIGGDAIDDWWVNIADADIEGVNPEFINPTVLQDPGDFYLYFDVDDNR